MHRIISPFLLLTLGFATPSFAGIKDGLHTRIVGGQEANRGEFPFIVSLQSSSGHFCGGSLVAKDWVLTAAHCVSRGAPHQVVIGLHDRSNTSDTEIFRTSQVIVHPQYESFSMNFDFALLRLDHESKYTPIQLNRNDLTGAIDLITAGWGTTGQGGSLANLLQKVTVPFVDQDTCSKSYPGEITDTMICAGYAEGGKDSCQGDSGGPLMMGAGAERMLVGVVSWGEGCAKPDKYGVYSRVSTAMPWVDTLVK